MDYVAPTVDPSTGTIIARGLLENADGVLLPGYFARVRVPLETGVEALLVPDAALVVRSSGTVLAVLQRLTPQEQVKVKAAGTDPAILARVRRVQFQKVDPGRDYGIELEIPAGLNVGQEVVVSPSDAVQEGALVQIADPNSNQKAPNSNPKVAR